MRNVIVILMLLAIAGTAVAQDLGNSRSATPKTAQTINYADPDVPPRQGGDTVDDAVLIPSLPYATTGTTVGYFDDYDVACSYEGSTSPDVVYSFTPGAMMWIGIDLCGSAYDTKTYVFDSGMNVMGCNDDYYYDDICGYYRSYLELELEAGELYYIVIDGYGGESGDYILSVTQVDHCYPDCPAEAVAEGEPSLSDGYEDTYNTGCNDDYGVYPFQDLDWTNDEDGLEPLDGAGWLCGVSGWYSDATGAELRDTDWFRVYALETGTMEFTVDSEYPCNIFKLAPLDCAIVEVELEAVADCGLPATLSFPVVAGEEIWLWVGPTTYTGSVNEFMYFMSITNNEFSIIGNEDMSWGDVKSLY